MTRSEDGGQRFVVFWSLVFQRDSNFAKLFKVLPLFILEMAARIARVS